MFESYRYARSLILHMKFREVWRLAEGPFGCRCVQGLRRRLWRIATWLWLIIGNYSVLNKIDLAQTEPERRACEITNVLGIPKESIMTVSAKEGTNIEALLDRVCEKVPPPKIFDTGETKALVFDSIYDSYKGVVAYVRVMSGRSRKVFLFS